MVRRLDLQGLLPVQAAAVLPRIQPSTQRGANPDVSPPLFISFFPQPTGRRGSPPSPWLGSGRYLSLSFFFLSMLTRTDSSWLGGGCTWERLESLFFVISGQEMNYISRPENCDKGNTLKVCKEETVSHQAPPFSFPPETLRLLTRNPESCLPPRSDKRGQIQSKKTTNPHPRCHS